MRKLLMCVTKGRGWPSPGWCNQDVSPAVQKGAACPGAQGKKSNPIRLDLLFLKLSEALLRLTCLVSASLPPPPASSPSASDNWHVLTACPCLRFLHHFPLQVKLTSLATVLLELCIHSWAARGWEASL